MKIVVIGGSGRIGSMLVATLRDQAQEVVAADLNSGVNTLTGEGLAEVIKGAAVVVDVSNSPSLEGSAALSFFETSTRNLLAAEAEAGVGHHVALSVVGTERLSESGYFLAKLAQEKLIRESSVPYSIVHATQFFEFVRNIADGATDGNIVRLAPVLIQPMAAEDVASAVGRTAVGSPVNGIVEVAGPDVFRLDELVRRSLEAANDPRQVVVDPSARYFGALLDERTLVPDGDAQLGDLSFEAWLSRGTGGVPQTSPASVASGTSTQTSKDNEFRVSDVPPGASLLVGHAVVFNVDGKLCATQAKCTHTGGPLSKGRLDGSTVTCPLHGSQFDVCTGKVLRGPAQKPLSTYVVTADGDVGRIEAASPSRPLTTVGAGQGASA